MSFNRRPFSGRRVVWRFEVGLFRKGLSEHFIAALADLGQKPGWWHDVLADVSLIIGIRDERFDVYWNGQSLFHVKFEDGRLQVNTHVKYLLDPDRSDRVTLDENSNFHAVSTPMLAHYTLGTLGTLGKLKRAANLFSGMEKQGVHAIVNANANIIDVEIRLDARDLDSDRDQPRIDIAAFEQQPNEVELVFWEAKLFANKELRAAGETPAPVVRQIKEYQQVLQARQSEVLSSYRCVAKNLVAIEQMSGGVRIVGSAIRAVADKPDELRMSSTANVGLVIFGFDSDQKAVGGIGHRHFEKLKEELGENKVRASGVADGLKLRLLR
jgi:hypothetical protein